MARAAGPGLLLQLNDTEGGKEGQIIAVDDLNTLNLKTDPATGEASIENPISGGLPYDIDGYLIATSSGQILAH